MSNEQPNQMNKSADELRAEELQRTIDRVSEENKKILEALEVAEKGGKKEPFWKRKKKPARPPDSSGAGGEKTSKKESVPVQPFDVRAVAEEIKREIEIESPNWKNNEVPQYMKDKIAQEMFLKAREEYQNKIVESSGLLKKYWGKTEQWWTNLDETPKGRTKKVLMSTAFIGGATIALGAGFGVITPSLYGIGARLIPRVVMATGLNMAITSNLPARFMDTFKKSAGATKTGWKKHLNLRNVAMAGGVGTAFLLSGPLVGTIALSGAVMRKALNIISDRRIEEDKSNLENTKESFEFNDDLDIDTLAAKLSLFEENYDHIATSLKKNKRFKNITNGALTIMAGVATMSAVAEAHGIDQENEQDSSETKTDEITEKTTPPPAIEKIPPVKDDKFTFYDTPEGKGQPNIETKTQDQELARLAEEKRILEYDAAREKEALIQKAAEETRLKQNQTLPAGDEADKTAQPKPTPPRLGNAPASVAPASETAANTASQQNVAVEEYLKNNPNARHDIHRKLWYDNDTPKPKFDRNELQTHWGGEKGTGIDKDGNYVLDVSKMTPDGSFHSGINRLSANAQELLKEGKLKFLISASRETQNKVFEVEINPDGQIIIPKDSDIAKLFFTTGANGRAQFTGRFGEVAEKLDDENNFRILSTVEGKDTGAKNVAAVPPAEIIDKPAAIPQEAPPKPALPVAEPVALPTKPGTVPTVEEVRTRIIERMDTGDKPTGARIQGYVPVDRDLLDQLERRDMARGARIQGYAPPMYGEPIHGARVAGYVPLPGIPYNPLVERAFTSNPFHLLPDTLHHVYEVYERNIIKLFPEHTTEIWTKIKAENADKFIKSEADDLNEPYRPLLSYLQELKEKTGLKPEKHIFRHDETIEEYMIRATQKAAKDGTLDKIEIKHTTDLQEPDASVREVKPKPEQILKPTMPQEETAEAVEINLIGIDETKLPEDVKKLIDDELDELERIIKLEKNMNISSAHVEAEISLLKSDPIKYFTEELELHKQILAREIERGDSQSQRYIEVFTEDVENDKKILSGLQAAKK